MGISWGSCPSPPDRVAMLLLDRHWRVVFAALTAAAMCSDSNAATKPQIIPLRTYVAFSAQSAENRKAVPIQSTDRRMVYVLSLEPGIDVGRHILTLDLVLKGSGAKTDAPNLLAPAGMWHGYQAYMFAGRDFTQGEQKSAFGEKRTIFTKRLGFVVRIDVSKVKVSLISDARNQPPLECGGDLQLHPPCEPPDYQFELLELQIEVENAPDRSLPHAAPSLTPDL